MYCKRANLWVVAFNYHFPLHLLTEKSGTVFMKDLSQVFGLTWLYFIQSLA